MGEAPPEVLARKVAGRLAVKFRQVVVHSVENWEADIANKTQFQETEWTMIVLLD
jgi:hypothetical protein